jgi:hypothetical protein
MSKGFSAQEIHRIKTLLSHSQMPQDMSQLAVELETMGVEMKRIVGPQLTLPVQENQREFAKAKARKRIDKS